MNQALSEEIRKKKLNDAMIDRMREANKRSVRIKNKRDKARGVRKRRAKRR